jgi:tyrosine-protein kinase Etk/Wzc
VDLVWEFQQVPEGHYTLVDAAEPGEPVAILFRRLINDLDARLEPEDWNCLGVASTEAQAGRTLAAANLAQSLAMKEYQAILVDADLRPTAGTRLAELFGGPGTPPGLLQALCGDVPIAAALYAAETAGLGLIDAGIGPPQGSRDVHAVAGPGLGERSGDRGLAQLGSRQFRSVVDGLRQSGRNLVFDLPPLDTHETVIEAASSLGSIVLVARSGHTTRAGLRETAERLDGRGAQVRGILLTDVPTDALDGAPLFPASKRRAWWRGSLRPAPNVRRDPPAIAPEPGP